MPRRPKPVAGSPLRAALDRIGDRWMLLVVDALADGPLRFGELGDRVGAAPNILTDRLRRLEAEGLVVATPYSERPVRFTYDLTARGPGAGHRPRGARPPGEPPPSSAPVEHFHDACGTGVELRPWCPTCDRLVGPDEATSAYDL